MLKSRWVSWGLWVIFGLYLLVQIPLFLGLAEQGRVPIDYLSYQRAAEALARGESPYLTPARSTAIWRSFHHLERDLLAAHARGQGSRFMETLAARPQQPGPYQYPPTLALALDQLKINFLVFSGVTLLAIGGFAWLWLRSTQASALGLLLIVGSHDVLASLHGGNVELILLFLTLWAARCQWDRHWWWAAPLIVGILLIKPFYVLLFVALFVFQQQGKPRIDLRTLWLPAGLMGVLVTLEVWRWGAPLRADTWHFLSEGLGYLWFALPLAEQTPMSAWNRTPLQGLVNTGVPLDLAQLMAMGLWLLLMGITAWRVRRHTLTFPLAFALALVLLYWGRPIGWGFSFLEVVVVVGVWPALRGWQQPAVLTIMLAVMASRWWAAALTLQGQGMQWLTLQNAVFPWETWIVLPLHWLGLLYALEQAPLAAPTGGKVRAAVA